MVKRADKIFIRPIVTEKSTLLEGQGKYIFEVSVETNKNEIKKAIQEIYKIKPLKVNIINKKGKNIRYGRTTGWTKNRKKAIVTFKKGEKIELMTK